jgi:type IV pilus assembly protein PilP
VRRLAAIAVLACVAFLATACQEQTATGPTAADYKAERQRLLAKMKKNKGKQQQPQQAATESSLPTEGGFGAVAATYTYDKKGKRDPFEPYRASNRLETDAAGPLMAYELGQLSVVAVVWDTGNPRALVADPRGETHVVREGTPIGKNDGLVIHIGDNMVLVKETYVDFAGEMTTNDVELRIRSTQGG